MSELSPADVEQFTGGRLSSEDPNVSQMLTAALVTARRYCGWVVTPAVSFEEVTLDGPGSRVLILPTLKLVELAAVTENGVELSVGSVVSTPGGTPAAPRPAAVRKTSGGWWSSAYQSIRVVMTHGYAEAEAADWRYAVLSMVDEMAQIQMSGTSDLDLVSKKVDDVTYRWADRYANAAEGALYSSVSVFNGYRLPTVEFM